MMRRKIYGLMMVGMMLLMAGCSTDDVVKETTSAEAIAISFSCNYDNEEENETRAGQQGTMGLTGAGQQGAMGAANQGAMGTTNQGAMGITRAGYQGAMNTEDLYATGFGVMASVTANNDPEDPGYAGANKPNLMYNQEVKYTFVGDLPLNPEIQPDPEPYRGYWSYYPLKYWPTDLEHCYISAYAPYVEPSELEDLLATETGIIGISANSVAPYIEYRRCETPASNVDLLWYYKKFESTDKIPEATTTLPAGTLNMKMRHALARLEIQVALAAAPAAGTKVLIEKITLTGRMAKTGRLHLYEQTTITEGEEPDVVTKYYPVWSDLVYDQDGGGNDQDHSIQIKNIDNDPDSYGVIDAQVRYIPGMPYAWQPEGLKFCDAGGTGNGYQNALSTGDRKGYVFLIPQETLALTVKVTYHKMTAGGDDTGIRTTVTTPWTVANPLRGNTTYALNLKLSGI